jgi:hypothetical protein
MISLLICFVLQVTFESYYSLIVATSLEAIRIDPDPNISLYFFCIKERYSFDLRVDMNRIRSNLSSHRLETNAISLSPTLLRVIR